MKHGTISAFGTFLWGYGWMGDGGSRFRVTASIVLRQVSLLGGGEFAVTQQTKNLVERGDFAFDAGDAFLGDDAAANVSHPGDCRAHRVVGPDHCRDAGFAIGGDGRSIVFGGDDHNGKPVLPGTGESEDLVRHALARMNEDGVSSGLGIGMGARKRLVHSVAGD